MRVTVSISASGDVGLTEQAETLRATFHTFTGELAAAGITGPCTFNAAEPEREPAAPEGATTEAP